MKLIYFNNEKPKIKKKAVGERTHVFLEKTN